MRPQREILRLRRQVETLKAQIKSLGAEVVEVPRWALDLTAQEAALMGVLIAKSPRVVNVYDLSDAIPHQDHVNDYDTHGINVVVVNIRKKLGFDAVENVWGKGYRVGPLFREAGEISRNHAAAACRAMQAVNCGKLGRPAALDRPDDLATLN